MDYESRIRRVLLWLGFRNVSVAEVSAYSWRVNADGKLGTVTMEWCFPFEDALRISVDGKEWRVAA